MRVVAAGVLAGLTLAGPAAAEVTAKATNGFTTRTVTEVAAPPEKVWAALGQVSNWWNPAHTYSGEAGRLSLEVKARGCFCERWPGGEVQHATVVMAMPNRTLRLTGGLGPLQALGASSVWTFELKPSAAGTTVTQTMTVGGWSPEGLEGLAAPVDGVLAEQQGRLKRFIETGQAGPGGSG